MILVIRLFFLGLVLLPSSWAQCPHSLFERASRRTGINKNLIHAVAVHESGCDQSTRGPCSEIGIMQILPSTAKSFYWDIPRLRTDPEYNVLCGAKYLSYLVTLAKARWNRDINDAELDYVIAGYNAGEKTIVRHEIPNRSYVRSVRTIFTQLGDGPARVTSPAVSIQPWIYNYVFSCSTGTPRLGVPLSFSVDVKNLGDAPAKSAHVVFSFRKHDWDIAEQGKPHIVVSSRDFDWVVSFAHRAVVPPGGSFEASVAAIPVSETPYIRVRAILESGYMKIGYPHRTAPEFLDPEGFPAKRIKVWVEH